MEYILLLIDLFMSKRAYDLALFLNPFPSLTGKKQQLYVSRIKHNSSAEIPEPETGRLLNSSAPGSRKTDLHLLDSF